jgi:hypothetical protein
MTGGLPLSVLSRHQPTNASRYPLFVIQVGHDDDLGFAAREDTTSTRPTASKDNMMASGTDQWVPPCTGAFRNSGTALETIDAPTAFLMG